MMMEERDGGEAKGEERERERGIFRIQSRPLSDGFYLMMLFNSSNLCAQKRKKKNGSCDRCA